MNLYIHNLNYDFDKIIWSNIKHKVVFDYC